MSVRARVRKRCTGVRGKVRLGHGKWATSDVLCSAVLARSAVDTGTAVAARVAVDRVHAPVVKIAAGIAAPVAADAPTVPGE